MRSRHGFTPSNRCCVLLLLVTTAGQALQSTPPQRQPRAPPSAANLIHGFQPPDLDELPMLRQQLSNIRKAVSPVYFSARSTGGYARGLGGLPPLEGPVLFIGNHQLFGLLDQPLLVEEIWSQTGCLVRSLTDRSAFRVVDPNGTNAAPANTNGGEGSEGGWLLSVDFAR